jgi:hypothetical protein
MTYPDGTLTKTGYLVPADGDVPEGSVGTWLNLDGWLREVAFLPPKHILVVLDACHSGVALNPVIRWRGSDMRLADPLERLRARRSRRIITSALDDQLAMDSGPIHGHSLFTGCLIEALTGGIAAKTGQSVLTGSQIGVHVQARVTTYPSSQQTPDFGALELDNRGELIIELPAQSDPAAEADPPVPGARLRQPSGPHEIWSTNRRIEHDESTAMRPADPARQTPPTGVDSIRSKRKSPVAHEATAPVESARSSTGSQLDAAFTAALHRHDAVRSRNGQVLTVVAAEPMTAMTGWATWAAARGRLTLITEKTGLDAAIADLLAQVPWLRSLPAARCRLATAARLDQQAIDTALDAQSAERASWIDRIAGRDRCHRVSGWLLSALREPWSQLSDLTTAPVQGADLLSMICKLAAPITVMFHHPSPTAPWVERAIRTASELVAFLPRQAIAVGAPGELVSEAVRADPDSSALAMARQGTVPLASRAVRASEGSARAELTLHGALSHDPRTARLFEPNVAVPIHDHERAAQVDLVARDAMLAIEIDDWYRLRDPQAYRRDRIKDVWLQRAGFFVLRFLADDVEDRLAQTLDEIALALTGRRASGSFAENTNDSHG